MNGLGRVSGYVTKVKSLKSSWHSENHKICIQV